VPGSPPSQSPGKEQVHGTVMAPTTDALYDLVGRALCGIDLFA
jgi:hypothetical protein